MVKNRNLLVALCSVAGVVGAVALSSMASPTATSYAASCTAPAWGSTTVYTVGQQVSYNGVIYQAKWWTQGDNPSQSGQWDVWKQVGTCGPTPTPTPAPTSTPASTPGATPTPTPTLTPTPTPTSTPRATATPTPTSTPACTVAAWNSATVYTGGLRVSYNGIIYEAKWWTQGDNPSQSGQWDVWKQVGTCGNPTPTATPTVTPTSTPT